MQNYENQLIMHDVLHLLIFLKHLYIIVSYFKTTECKNMNKVLHLKKKFFKYRKCLNLLDLIKQDYYLGTS